MKRIMLLTITALTISGCSMNTISPTNWKNYESERLNTENLSENQSLAVFYRTANFQGSAIDVFVNGEYQTSLLDQGYSPAVVCANNVSISSSYNSKREFGNRTDGKRYNLAAKEITYFRATKDKAQKPVFEQVDNETGEADLSKLKGKVVHTLSRTTKKSKCN